MELIGRRQQLALLHQALELASSGRPQFVVLEGPAGIGKSRLMEHLATQAAPADVRVLRGACIELGAHGLPLAPLTAMLRDLIGQLGREAVAALAPGAETVFALLPEAGVGSPLDVGGKSRLFEVFGTCLERLGHEQLVLLLVDDLRWADHSTRELLGYLARRLRTARVMAVLAHRGDDLPLWHPLPAFVAELERLPAVRRLVLPRLTRVETTELLESLTGSPPAPGVVDNVLRRAGGNPLYTEQLAGAEHLPGSLKELLLERTRDLPDTCRNLVALAAVGGQAVSHDLLAEVAELPEEELLEGLHQAVQARALLPHAGGYRFPHALLREAVLADLLPARLTQMHRRFAQALEARPELVAPERHAGEMAHHWHGAGAHARALPALLSAAQAAGSVSCHTEQAQLLTRALELCGDDDRQELLHQALMACLWAGESVQGLDLIARALSETDPAPAPGQRAILLAHRAILLANLGLEGVQEALEEAAALLPAEPSVIRAAVLDRLAAILLVREDLERGQRAGIEAVDVAEALDEHEVRLNARITVATIRFRLGDHTAGLAELRQAGKAAEARGDITRTVRVKVSIAACLAGAGRYHEAAEAARAGLPLAHAAGTMRSLGAAMSEHLATSLFALGQWDEAAHVMQDGLAHDPEGRYAVGLQLVDGELALARGDMAAARERLAAAELLDGGEGTSSRSPAIHRLAAAIAYRDNRLEDAHRAIRNALPPLQKPGMAPVAWPALVLAAALVRSTRLSTATDPVLLKELQQTMRSLPTDTPLWAACAAQVEAELGAIPWAPVIEAWQAVGDPYRIAYARTRAAESAAWNSDRAAVQELLSMAAQKAAALGAQPLLRDIAQLARSAHVKLHDHCHEPAGRKSADQEQARRLGLTERELEVLRHMADGASNRRIASGLFISPKTVSVHVTRILAKLEASNRGEATAMARRLGLLD
ncbi:regulatory LuxR family protein [Nonomuraea polychroma]|uniref:Regulatory LuxR family protein n=1 Tax=Nonomuraea polychroma TaxID=46176 RepID=A0A438M6T6_9ACTN|nr:helix-turn-helix transcriptional regulator [Nonomuraea polychroma]RVX41408.1 regulatory LuxR family protein [Nonomuraea polychroma]